MRTRSTLVATLAVAALAAGAFTPAAPDLQALRAPDGVPDRGAVLSEPIRRGALELTEAAATAPSVKTIDGDASDWIGEATRVGGTSRFDTGELVHSDFLFDAHGADDGADRARLEQFGDLFYAETRAERIDQVLRTSGSQLGVPEPLGAPDQYGDVGGGLDVADITEVRLASDGEDLQVLVSVANLTDASKLGVLLLADTGEQATDGLAVAGLATERFAAAVLAADGEATALTPTPPFLVGQEHSTDPVTATSATGYENHLELSVDLRMVAAEDGTLDVAIVAGRMEDDGSFTPLNVAFRGDEPVEIFNDRAQAFALLDGTVDAFSSGPIAIADLVDGRSQDWTFGAGYFERSFTSREDMSREGGRDGIHQPYGLYVPTSWEPGAVTPMTYWLHYRGGKAHSGTVINPRLTTQLGEERGNLVVFPNGRGTSEWYVTESHQDVLEVMGDAEGIFEVDQTRRYVSGYSMGGYGSWLFASLYPDLFAAAFVQSGAITQGAWVGTGGEGDPFDPLMDQGWVEANDGDARAQLTYRAVENLLHVPFAIDHGTNDELALNPQIERMGEKLTRLGYQHRLTRFLGYEHFTQAIVDEWADGAAYLDRFTIDPNPRDVTYAVVPALVHALNTVDPAQGASFDFDPDGAYWVDDIEVREVGDRGEGRPALEAKGTVHATAHAIPAAGTVTIPDAGAVSPIGHSTPFVRTGLQQVVDPSGLTAPTVSNALAFDLENVAGASAIVGRTGLDLEIRVGNDVYLQFATDGATEVRLIGALAGDSLLSVAAADPLNSGMYAADGDDLIVTLPEAGIFGIGVGVAIGPEGERQQVLTLERDGVSRTHRS